MAVTFDTLKASRQLQQAGFDEAKANALVSTFAGNIATSLATKADLADVRTEIRSVEQRLTIRTGAMVAGGVAVLLTAMGIITAIILAAI